MRGDLTICSEIAQAASNVYDLAATQVFFKLLAS
jgi:hypothetical protein